MGYKMHYSLKLCGLGTNPILSGSLFFICWEKYSSEHFQEAGEFAPWFENEHA